MRNSGKRAQDKLGPQVNVEAVRPQISWSDFIKRLYEMNVDGLFSSREDFEKNVRFASKTWTEANKDVSIVLKVTNEAMKVISVYVIQSASFRLGSQLLPLLKFRQQV